MPPCPGTYREPEVSVMRNPLRRSAIAHQMIKPLHHGSRVVPVVYVEPGNPACQRTIAAFDSAGAEIERVDVTADIEAREAVETAGYQRFPVVDTGTAIWSGHQAAEIRAFIETVGPNPRERTSS